MADFSNIALWNRFKSGDDEALSAIYTLYAQKLYSYGLKILNDEPLVKDCIQDLFFNLIINRKKLEVSPFTHVYLFKSLRNNIYEQIRSGKRQQEILNNLIEKVSPVDKDPEQTIISTEETSKIRNALKSAIGKLTKHQQEAIYLKYTEGFSYEDISRMLDVDISSVRTLIYRSLKGIREILKNTSSFILFLFRLKK